MAGYAWWRKSVGLLFFFLLQNLYAETRGDEVKSAVNEALQGLSKKTRFARGLQDQCVDVYEDLEKKARKAGTDFLHNNVANWHYVKNQDRRLDILTKELTNQENEFSKKYETDVIGLSESLQLLEPIKAKKKEILDYQSDLTTKILELNDLAAKVAREKFYEEIKFLAKNNVPCLRAIYKRWEGAYDELKDGDARESKVELKEENESKEQVTKKDVEAALKVYEEKIMEFYKLSQAVPELKVKLKDAGFNGDGTMNEIRKLRKFRVE